MWAKDEPLLYGVSHHAGHNPSVDSLLGTVRKAVQKMTSSAETMQALARQPDSVTRIERAQTLNKQS